MQSNLKRLRDIFIDIERDGFDVNSKLKWGFYFFDSSRSRLLTVYEELKDYNYSLESIEEADDNEWRLCVCKIDILTPETLHRRNNAFNELAANCGVKLYDGWDVERIK
ncbi:MAG TPA: ribonuclease E inhibitor RraB [Mucilaginibacter sp.]|nr:ribonuclease E inhibitor RraB [Mucilaginibacter sp.]